MVVLRFRSLFRHWFRRHRLLVWSWIHGKFLLIADPGFHFIFRQFWLWSNPSIGNLNIGLRCWWLMILWQVARLESIEMYHQPVVAPTISAIWGYYLDAVCYIRENFHHPIIWHKCNNIIILKTGMAQAIPAVLAPMGHAKDTTQVDCITITMHSLTIVLLHDPQIEE